MQSGRALTQAEINQQYQRIYQATYFQKNWITRAVKWLLDVNQLLEEHSPDKIRNADFYFFLQAVLNALKYKNAHMNRVSRWIIGLQPMITQCEVLLKNAYLLRYEAQVKSSYSSPNQDCKRSSTLTIRQEIKNGDHDALSAHLQERLTIIKPLFPEEKKTIIPTQRINYFTRGVGFPIRWVHPRVSGGKTMTYGNLRKEILESYRERERLDTVCPTGYNSNRLNEVPDFKEWSDKADDCEARRSYAEFRIKKEYKKMDKIEITFNDRGIPSLVLAAPRGK